MSRQITLREANQRFAQCVRAVEAGEELVITRNGRPVAKLVPIAAGRRVLTPVQQAAWERARAIMEEGWEIGAGPLDRDALHER
jgi:prevent-host-death family protein